MLMPFNQLFAKYQIKPAGILHIGAHWGEEADEYDRFRGLSQVVWVEALPEAFLKLNQNVAHRPGHFTIHACVTDRDGDWVQFKIASNQGQSSSILDFGTHSKEHPEVRFISARPMRTARMDSILKANRIKMVDGWFLNIDLQGAELLALKGMGEYMGFVSHAYIEVNEAELYKGCPLIGDIDGYMEQWGLIRRETKMTGAKWGDALYCRG